MSTDFDQYKASRIMKWISVKDCLPECGDWVLIHIPVKGQSLIEIAMLDILEEFINPEMGYGCFKNVSHWMPLPKPPSVKNDPCNCPICDEETKKILDETYHKHAED